MKKFDKIRRLGKDEGATFANDELVIIQEKLDGSNFRVWVEDGELRFGSRNIEFLPESDPNVGYGNFHRAVQYVKENLAAHIMPGHIYYFEAMIKHTLPYEFDKHPAAILIDIYDLECGEYIDPAVLALNEVMPVAPTVFHGHFRNWDGEVPQSQFGPFQAEGVVIKTSETTYDSFGNIHRAKVVTDKFREENRKVFGVSNDKESGFAIKYATQARIEKHINHLEDVKGEQLQPQWVPIISYNVTKDICDEEFKKLMKMKNPNLQTIKKEVERQVKLVLSQRGVL